MRNGVETIICLVGGQPTPVFIRVLHLAPKRAVFAHTDVTRPQGERIRNLVSARVESELLRIDAYDVTAVQLEIEKWLTERGWPPERVWINMTGGTKPMTLGAFAAAARKGARLLYLQSEGGKSLLYSYEVDRDWSLKGQRNCAPGARHRNVC